MTRPTDIIFRDGCAYWRGKRLAATRSTGGKVTFLKALYEAMPEFIEPLEPNLNHTHAHSLNASFQKLGAPYRIRQQHGRWQMMQLQESLCVDPGFPTTALASKLLVMSKMLSEIASDISKLGAEK